MRERDDENAGRAKAPLGLESLFADHHRPPKLEQVYGYVDAEVVEDEPKSVEDRFEMVSASPATPAPAVQSFEPRKQQTALEWMSLNLGGLTEDEAITAETMLGNGISKYTVQSQINLARKPRLGRHKPLHPSKDTSEDPKPAEIPTATAEKSAAS